VNLAKSSSYPFNSAKYLMADNLHNMFLAELVSAMYVANSTRVSWCRGKGVILYLLQKILYLLKFLVYCRLDLGAMELAM
jgi:hypothetical protein